MLWGHTHTHIASAFTYAPPMEALCSPHRFASAFEIKQRHHREEYNLHTGVKIGPWSVISFSSYVHLAFGAPIFLISTVCFPLELELSKNE